MSVAITMQKKADLDAAGQMWVEYHMNALRQHMQALGMIEQPQEPIAPAIEANHLDEQAEEDETIYSPRIDDDIDSEADGEMVDDDPIPVRHGKRKPSSKRTFNQPKVRRYVQHG